jgi:serine/threonine protein kinase
MASQPNAPLPEGYRLNQYRIEKKLSAGGFSIVYLARDENDNPVAIKEYLPSGLVARTGGDQVLVTSEEKLAHFRNGMKCFFEEGLALAKISHPNVVRVENFFRANETVYMVMGFVRGRTLQHHITHNRAEFTESFMRRLFMNLLNGLREVHTHKLLHLDIKPANIYIVMDGTPILLDFGAARQALHNDRPKLKSMYTNGFAAPEQYLRTQDLGPWTDIYSIGASMYSCLSGGAPQSANERMIKDELPSPHDLWGDQMSAEFLNTIEWCMKLAHDERPPSVMALQKALLMEATPPKVGTTSLFDKIKDRLTTKKTKSKSKPTVKNKK